MLKMQISIGAALAAMLMVVAPAMAQPVEFEGHKFEPTVQLAGQTLHLNGIGLRKRAFFKVYAAGLYAPQKGTNAAPIIESSAPRRVSLRMLRDVDADSFISAFNDGLRANHSDAQMAKIAPQAESLTTTLKAVGEAKRGDAINFDYLPDTGTVITVNGQPRGQPIPGAEFYAAVLRVWLGDKPADDGLKRGMLGA